MTGELVAANANRDRTLTLGPSQSVGRAEPIMVTPPRIKPTRAG